ncbi:MAG: hypothetical protein WD011_00920, partial [Nitriliruptoraceae bacterium]
VPRMGQRILELVAVLPAAVRAGGLTGRRAAAGAMQRLSSVLCTASVAGSAWFTAIIAADALAWSETPVAIATSAVALAVAVALYVTGQRALLQLATLAALIALLLALSTLTPLPVDHRWQAAAVGALGAAWMLLARGGWHKPWLVADIAGAALVLIGLQVAAGGEVRVALLAAAVIAAGGFVAAAVVLDQLHLLVVGALGLFVTVPQLVFELFGDRLGAPATLLLVGLLLVVLAVGLGRARREVARGGVAPPPAPAHTSGEDTDV